MESSTRKPFHQDNSAPADYVMTLNPQTITNLFNIPEPLISGTNKATSYVEQLESVTLRFPVSKDGRPLCEIKILVDNIPFYVRDECLDECTRTIMRYIVADAFLSQTKS